MSEIKLNTDRHDIDDLLRYLDGDHHMSVYDRLQVAKDIRAQLDAPRSEPEKLRPLMACNHGDDGKANCDALRAEVCAALECEPDQLVTAVVYALNWEHGVSVTGIPCDMWSAVQSEYVRLMTDEESEALGDGDTSAEEWVTEATCYAQCDRIEDGFALTWKTWTDWFEKRKAAADAE